MKLYLLQTCLFLVPMLTHGASKIDNLCLLKTTGSYGKCKPLKDCKVALDKIKKNQGFPQICDYQDTGFNVCCPLQHGEISKEKCKEYSVYAYEKVGTKKKPTCDLTIPLIIGGEHVERREFPHMAAIGSKEVSTNITWLCGGSLISDQFVLTAAHCFIHQDKNITIVRLGIVDLTSSDHRQDIGVSQFIIHPKYRYPSTYHDIALIKLEKTVILNPYTRPACLYLKKKFMGDEITATGWGSTTIDGNSPSKVLLKAQLEIADMSFCNITYLRHISRKVYMGISNMQFCAQSPDEQKDTCHGDSGGPLQVNHVGDDLICMHDIVGITSFGRMCASGPAVYVNVLHYVKWIENEVWLK